MINFARMNVRELKPTSVWNHFADLNAVPRPSKKEEKVIAFIQDFGEKLNLETWIEYNLLKVLYYNLHPDQILSDVIFVKRVILSMLSHEYDMLLIQMLKK